MSLISADFISRRHGDRVLFEDVRFSISEGDKIAFIGTNGSGKTSILEILAGIDTPDSGDVSYRRGLKISYLPQHPLAKAKGQIMDVIDVPADEETSAKKMLGKLGVHDLEKRIEEMSGGQRKRVAIARALLEKPDVLILDEPTNHLDIDTIEWLERYLNRHIKTLLVVTHDRFFLDAVCSEILELDRGNVMRFRGTYAYYLEKKADHEAEQDASVSKARNLLRKELEWARRMPKARTTKSKARLSGVDVLKEKAEGRGGDGELNLSVKTRRLGKTILELEEVSKSYDDLKLLHDYSYIFKKGERVGMIGPNGVGKTTFLEILTGTLQPDSGEVKVGVNTSFGYYKQQEPTYKPGQRVLEVVTDIAENIALANGSLVSASQFLNMFHFPPPRQQVLAEKLSGGEKRRLALLCVLIANPNFLVLDEPTNDLDLITLSALESFLEEFAGCLIIVSHDRFFMDRLCDHLFVFEGEGKIRDFPGNYSEYRKEVKEKEEKVKDSNKQKTGKKEKTASVRKLSFKEQRELEILTTDLEEAETRKTELEANLNGGTQDFDELASWGSELQDLIKKIDEMTERWLELEEINENS